MNLNRIFVHVYFVTVLHYCVCRDEEKIMKACYWPNEVYDPCFGGCAEVSCDNPRNHQRPCYPYCEPGCICESPYVRDDRTHQCVLPQDCSPTQLGIPVTSPRNSNTPSNQMFKGHQTHRHSIRQDFPALEFSDTKETRREVEPRRNFDPEARLGNYFNIVIAPPPIKTLRSGKYDEAKE